MIYYFILLFILFRIIVNIIININKIELNPELLNIEGSL